MNDRERMPAGYAPQQGVYMPQGHAGFPPRPQQVPVNQLNVPGGGYVAPQSAAPGGYAPQQQHHQQPYQQPQAANHPVATPYGPPPYGGAPPQMYTPGYQAPGAGPTAGPSMPAPFEIPGLNSFVSKQIFDSAASTWIKGQRDFMENNAEFLKLPKYYFAVNTSYVLRKLMLILFPLKNKSWVRRKIDDSAQMGGNVLVSEGGYLPPSEDLNAPDLYIPVMSFVTYVLLVGFISGTRGTFTPELMASTASLGLAVLAVEVLLIRLGLYLVNARTVPWLDLIAFRGYKFVGLTVVLVGSMLSRYLFWPLLVYAASMMGLFLMRTYKKIVQLKAHESNFGVGSAHEIEQTRKNHFLLGIAAIQFPIYWILAHRA
ncbi:Protein transport protein yif1 [Porphyridium purpureum]|uniref:Protein YIF1 n=1 Tax=Porphyridium purpureum TaxID=35688 RepID=A0A5J4Z6U6_PORPP|nr:Protein transport protein yif1 [Porphyridium purpureum]|eukprot:POR0376..scf295_1